MILSVSKHFLRYCLFNINVESLPLLSAFASFVFKDRDAEIGLGMLGKICLPAVSKHL